MSFCPYSASKKPRATKTSFLVRFEDPQDAKKFWEMADRHNLSGSQLGNQMIRYALGFRGSDLLVKSGGKE